MEIASKTIIFIAVVLLIFGVGGILLQIFLSKKESKWPGLILPIISFAISLIAILNVADIGDKSSVIATLLSIFLLYNIPTVVLLVIYTACRGKRKRQHDLEKMSVQDLE